MANRRSCSYDVLPVLRVGANRAGGGEMNVRDIVEAYLKEHGYDGLCKGLVLGDCACFVVSENGRALLQCDNPIFCQPGYKNPNYGEGEITNKMPPEED